MNLTSSIKVDLPCGKQVSLSNTLTYTGVNSITRLLGKRQSELEFTHLYLRYATVRIDADEAATNFSSQKDIRKCSVEDFKTELGSASFAIFPITAGSQLMSSDTELYQANIIRFAVSFQAAGLGVKFKDTNLSNYSIIYYMGLAERPKAGLIPNFDQTKHDAGDYDNILSVIRISDEDLFGVPATGTVDVKYDLNLNL